MKFQRVVGNYRPVLARQQWPPTGKRTVSNNIRDDAVLTEHDTYTYVMTENKREERKKNGRIEKDVVMKRNPVVHG